MNALEIIADGAHPLLTFVETTTGQRVNACYQCGKCAAGCPVAGAMDLMPQQVLRGLELGQEKLVLDSRTIWLCVGCQACATRCPNQVDLPRIMDAVRSWAVANGRQPAEREVRAFHRVFLKSIELTGRVYEVGLIGGYNVTSGHLFSGFDLALPMIGHGKIRMIPQRVRRRREVASLFRRSARMLAEDAKAEPSATESAAHGRGGDA